MYCERGSHINGHKLHQTAHKPEAAVGSLALLVPARGEPKPSNPPLFMIDSLLNVDRPYALPCAFLPWQKKKFPCQAAIFCFTFHRARPDVRQFREPICSPTTRIANNSLLISGGSGFRPFVCRGISALAIYNYSLGSTTL
jgi:hypothetical protein